jgi:membrane protease YdiL (CAAX protease family)
MSKASDPAQRGVAPAWHTALLVGLILVVAITGVCISHSSDAAPVITWATRPTPSYLLPSILVAWALAAYVCRVGRPRSALASLVGELWTRASRALGDMALAAAAFFLIEACELGAAAFAHGAVAPESVRAILPSTQLERGVWVAFAVSVGVSEELVYRGYLRVQLTAFTGKPSLGILFQGILFGVAHLDQGLASAARLAFYGIALGALAAWRRSLLPGMMAHVAIDLASGLTHR